MTLLLVVVCGCSTSALASDPSDPFASRGKGDSQVRLTVQNDDFKDATIYAIWEGGSRRRIGVALGKASTTFTLDWVAGRVALEADFIGGEPFSVEALEVSEGDHLNLVILNQG